MSNNKKREFAKVHDNGLKEIFDKDRKYDSIFDEHHRIFQSGKGFKVKRDESKKSFNRLALKLFKISGFKLAEVDLFKGNIVPLLNKKGKEINRIKIIKCHYKMPKMIFQFQMMIEKGEVRTTIELTKPIFSKKYLILTFIQLFKRDETFFGVNDAIRKRMLKKQVLYRTALLAKEVNKINLLYKDVMPAWAEQVLMKKKVI